MPSSLRFCDAARARRKPSRLMKMPGSRERPRPLCSVAMSAPAPHRAEALGGTEILRAVGEDAGTPHLRPARAGSTSLTVHTLTSKPASRIARTLEAVSSHRWDGMALALSASCAHATVGRALDEPAERDVVGHASGKAVSSS